MNPYVCPVVCPVCGGNGLVTQGFYNQTSGQWSTSTTAPETCRTCGGTGIVGATPTHLQPFKSKEVETGYNIEFEVLTIEAIDRAIKTEAEVERLKTENARLRKVAEAARDGNTFALIQALAELDEEEGEICNTHLRKPCFSE